MLILAKISSSKVYAAVWAYEASSKQLICFSHFFDSFFHLSLYANKNIWRFFSAANNYWKCKLILTSLRGVLFLILVTRCGSVPGFGHSIFLTTVSGRSLYIPISASIFSTSGLVEYVLFNLIDRASLVPVSMLRCTWKKSNIGRLSNNEK